ncbi:MAG TPA: formimidoylglutamate deiminase [Pyrinomonadaceae bacterium]
MSDPSFERTAWLPDLLYTGTKFESGLALVCDAGGSIAGLTREPEGFEKVVRLKGRAMLPGLVNAHSHAFQRVIRGRTERRTRAHDSFWSWRELMYSAAGRLTPEDIYDASRMAFMEMALAGITAVGEFHYLHHAPGGAPFEDPNLLAKEVIRAALDVGLRIALLRVAYARAGHDAAPDPVQLRFIETRADAYLENLLGLDQHLRKHDASSAWAGIALHSVRALPLDYLQEIARFKSGASRSFPVHIHVAEQPAEVSACLAEHGRTPVGLLENLGLLDEHLTAVHAIHITREEAQRMAATGARACVCPTTERNLGDGIFSHAEPFLERGCQLALGTDSQTQIDLLEDARELELHLRLERMERAVLAPVEDESAEALAARLFACATVGGAMSIGARGGALETGRPADFFTVDLEDPSIAGAGADDLLASILFSLERTAIRDVCVGGRRLIEDGRHPSQPEIVERFKALQKRLWS